MSDREPHIAHNIDDREIVRSSDVVSGENITFEELKLSHQTLQGLQREAFTRPSPVQLETVSLGRCGLDLVVRSKNGTGKTCVFTIVALEALQANSGNFTQTLIIAPTREIADQIFGVIKRLGAAYEELNCALCIGKATSEKEDRETLRVGCQIVIGTPGRILKLIERNFLKTRQIELFVLDEVDELMKEELKIQVDEIYKRLSPECQMIVTSATYPDEPSYSDRLSEFLKLYMRAPIEIDIGVGALEAIEEYFIMLKPGRFSNITIDNKLKVIKRIFRDLKPAKCFIFTNYHTKAPLIYDKLNEDENFLTEFGVVNYICGELDQKLRMKILSEFKQSNERRALVSTDLLGRGIDIRKTDLVINLDLPKDNTTYCHRIGRAGRFGLPGKAITIVSMEERSHFERVIMTDRIIELPLPSCP